MGGRTPQPGRLEEKVVDALRTVFDPEIPVNIYELGLVYDIRIDESRDVFIRMTLTSPHCPEAEALPGYVRRAIEEIPEVRSAEVEIVWEPPWSPDRMSEAAKLELGFL